VEIGAHLERRFAGGHFVRSERLKAGIAWGLVLASVGLCGFHYFALWTLAATFAKGLAWWASILMVLGPPVAVTSLIFSLRSPRQVGACVISWFVILTFVLLWAPIVLRLSFRHKG